MECEEYRSRFSGWGKSKLTSDAEDSLSMHLTECVECREDLMLMDEVWDKLGEVTIPEPSAHFYQDFQIMLASFKKTAEKDISLRKNLAGQLRRVWRLQPRLPLAYTMLFMLTCFTLGVWFFQHRRVQTEDYQLRALTSQVHDLRQTMMIALLANPSASERIKAVTYTSEINSSDKQVLDALMTTLNNDPNVNVRLVTLEALTSLAGHPKVREGLIRSISQQDSPLMQSAIADVMLKLQERRSVGSFRGLLKQKGLDKEIRQKLTQTINTLR